PICPVRATFASTPDAGDRSSAVGHARRTAWCVRGLRPPPAGELAEVSRETGAVRLAGRQPAAREDSAIGHAVRAPARASSLMVIRSLPGAGAFFVPLRWPVAASTASFDLPRRSARLLQALPGGLRRQSPHLDGTHESEAPYPDEGCPGSR